MKRRTLTKCIIVVLIFALSAMLMACSCGGKKPVEPESESPSMKETQKQTTTAVPTTTEAPTETTSATVDLTCTIALPSASDFTW